MPCIPASAWVIVTGDVTRFGGQDKANYALATYLANRGSLVHMVAHRIDTPLASHSQVRCHLVPKTGGSYFLGQYGLNRAGRRVAREVLSHHADARVVVNGGNCDWDDINWVHMVHHASRRVDAGAPWAFQFKNRLVRWHSLRSERSVVPKSRLVFANSEKTRRDIVRYLDLPAERVHTVYLGCDPLAYGPVTPRERAAARKTWGLAEDQFTSLFVGVLGYDQNKGFDTLLHAWKNFCAVPARSSILLAAGAGAMAYWQSRIDALGLASRVRLLGPTDRIPELLAAADLFVSPTRYDAYGLSVHEALCRGVPAIVSACAGVAERYPAKLGDLLLSDPENSVELAKRIETCRARTEELRPIVEKLAALLRANTWEDMAARIVSIAEASS